MTIRSIAERTPLTRLDKSITTLIPYLVRKAEENPERYWTVQEIRSDTKWPSTSGALRERGLVSLTECIKACLDVASLEKVDRPSFAVRIKQRRA